MDLTTIAAALQEERARLIDERTSIGAADALQSPSEELGESSDYANHPADSATATFDRTIDTALLENIDLLIQKVDRALAKISERTYGVCDRCGQMIADQRLEAMPSATLCLVCQDMEDNI